MEFKTSASRNYNSNVSKSQHPPPPASQSSHADLTYFRRISSTASTRGFNKVHSWCTPFPSWYYSSGWRLLEWCSFIDALHKYCCKMPFSNLSNWKRCRKIYMYVWWFPSLDIGGGEGGGRKAGSGCGRGKGKLPRSLRPAEPGVAQPQAPFSAFD